MVVEVERRGRETPRPKPDEVDQLKQLIAIQTQIVELAKRNELTEKQCEALRRELAERTSSPRATPNFFWRSVRRIWHWLRRIPC